MARMSITAYRIAVAYLHRVGSAYGFPYLFRSYDQNDMRGRDDRIHTPTAILPTWQVARALLAAPSYFSPIKVGDYEFSGRSKELRNPSLQVFHEVTRMLEAPLDAHTLFVSIGSGSFTRPQLETKGPLPEIWPMGDTTSSNVKLRGKGYTYHRLNPGHRLNHIKYDEWRKSKGTVGNTTMDQISHETETYLADPLVRENLRAIAMNLVRKRRARSEKKNMERYNSLSVGNNSTWSTQGLDIVHGST